MLRISHRVNSVDKLLKVNSEYGIEVDIRANAGDIYLSHDPFIPGELLSDLLEKYSHKLIVLNVKEDGLEDRTIELLNQYNITEYFFLDQPFPTLRRNSLVGRNCAVRVSENELMPKGLESMTWIWIDSFSGDWNHLAETAKFAQEKSLKTCLVSPELQGREYKSEIDEINSLLKNQGIMVDAVCTKFPEDW